jgi:hypothetical protein
MQNKILILLLLSIIYLPIAQAEEISVVSADTTWSLNLSDATEVGRLVGDPGVMVVKYADAITYNPLGNPSDVVIGPEGPDVMVVKYADAITYNPLENPSEIDRLAGEPGVMVVKYADTFTYYPLENMNPPPTPQISSITPNQTAAGTFDLTINGNYFDSSGAVDQIYWKADQHFVGNGTIKTRSATQIVVTESMANATPGAYVIKVKNSDGNISNGADLTITAQPFKSVVSFSPQNVELQPGSSQNVQIMMSEVPSVGLSGSNITVSVLDPAVANITAVSSPAWNGIPGNSTSTIPSSSVWIKAVNFGQIHPGDTNVSLGNITITGKSAGTTNLSIVPTAIEDNVGDPINADVITGNIHVVLIPVFPGCTKTPTDPNNDGFYEDINGNGRLDFADVVTYYNNMAWITQNGMVAYFDYNKNGRIDFNDVVRLYNMH